MKITISEQSCGFLTENGTFRRILFFRNSPHSILEIRRGETDGDEGQGGRTGNSYGTPDGESGIFQARAEGADS